MIRINADKIGSRYCSFNELSTPHNMHDISDDQTRPSSPSLVINPENPSLKRVRIILSSSPPFDLQMSHLRFENSNHPNRCSQRTSVSLSQGDGCVVFPIDKIQEGEENFDFEAVQSGDNVILSCFESSSSLTRISELIILDVEHEWSSSQRQRILLISPGLLIAYRSRFIRSTAYHYPRDVEEIGLR